MRMEPQSVQAMAQQTDIKQKVKLTSSPSMHAATFCTLDMHNSALSCILRRLLVDGAMKVCELQATARQINTGLVHTGALQGSYRGQRICRIHCQICLTSQASMQVPHKTAGGHFSQRSSRHEAIGTTPSPAHSQHTSLVHTLC